MKKVILLTLVLSFVFVSVRTVLAIPPHINNRCENGEFISMSDYNNSEENAYKIALPEGVQVCSVFVTMNDTVYRFTGDFESPQAGFYVTGLGMNKVYYNNIVSLWYQGDKPDTVEVYYRNDLTGENTPTVTPTPNNSPNDPDPTPTDGISPPDPRVTPEISLDDPLYLPVIIK